MARFLDLESWPRRRTFEYFRGYDKPYFNICTALEAGPLVELVRSEPDVSFFLAYLYLSLRAANESEPFRYRLSEGRILVHERIHAGTTILLDDESFGFAYFDYTEDFAQFQAAARVAMAHVRAHKDFDPQDQRTDLIQYSILPWVSFTSFSHARNWGEEDSIPKMVFGKATERKGEWLLPVSVEVHHALMDGLHVGRYLETLQGYCSQPTPVIVPAREGGAKGVAGH